MYTSNSSAQSYEGQLELAATAIPWIWIVLTGLVSVGTFVLAQISLKTLQFYIPKWITDHFESAVEDNDGGEGCLVALIAIVTMTILGGIMIAIFWAIAWPLVKSVFGLHASYIADYVSVNMMNGRWENLDYKIIVTNLLWGALVPFLIARLPTYFIEFKEVVQENNWYRQLFKEGKGGSARWAGIGTYKKHFTTIYATDAIDDGITQNRIIFGKSLLEDDPLRRTVSDLDDAHLLTVGMTGSGKSTTVLYPNIAMYNGSMIILDPKGELANATYARRGKIRGSDDYVKNLKNGKAYVLDPFGETSNLPTVNYNPLQRIDLEDSRAGEYLSAISDACVLPEKGDGSTHFVENAKNLIEAVIVHVLSKYPTENHNLPFAYDLIHGIDADLGVADPTQFQTLLYVMMKNNAMGGLPQSVASTILGMGEREKGSVLSTVTRSLKWISDPAMRKHLQGESGVRFDQFPFQSRGSGSAGGAIKTAYVVLPDGMMAAQMRWLRMIISVSLTAMKNVTYKVSKPTLFVMDEFPRLGGKIEAVSEGYGILRGYNIKLWAFIQDIGQLKKDYPDRWSSMTANSTVQVFGVNDTETAKWVAEKLGGTMIRRTEKRRDDSVVNKKKVVHEAAYNLLTPSEVSTMLGKGANRQIVFPNDGFPMRLERLAFKPLKGFRCYPLKYHFRGW